MSEKPVEPLKVTIDPKDPNLLDNIKKDYLDPNIIGENPNTQLLFLIACSPFTSKPLSAIVKGPSAAGKSHLVNRVLDPFRELGIVIEFSRITPAFLENMAAKNKLKKPKPPSDDTSDANDPKNVQWADYWNKVKEYEEEEKKPRTVDLTGRILFVDELRGIQSAQAPKLIISEGRLRLGTVDQQRESTTVEVRGTPSIITTTTQAALEDPEFENRVLPVQIDETEDHTKEILEHEAQRFADPSEDPMEYVRTVAIVQFFQKLKTVKVANPFAT